MRPPRTGILWLVTATSVVFGLSFCIFPVRAYGAASLFVGPASGTFTVGSTFTVSIYLNTGGQFVNAVEANVSFPPDKLQVVSPTTGKSLIQVWVNQPTYSNVDGTLKFQGAIPNPGINTESGVISTVTFRVKATGTATVRVLDSSRVLLNDGRGTDVLGQATDGLYYLTFPPPAGPIVTSPTNPDQEKWYATKNTVFRLEAPPDIGGFSYVLNSLPVDEPDDISEGLKTAVAHENLTDGTHYFHIKSLRAGIWGGITHYKVNIDNTPPAAFEIDVSPAAYTSQRRPIIAFETTDNVSGIDHYELKIISLDLPVAQTAEINKSDTPFFIEAMSPYSTEFKIGRYAVAVQAYDMAGNMHQAMKRLTIVEPLFEVIRGEGVRLYGRYVVPWPYALIIAVVLLALFVYLARLAWLWHRWVEKQFKAGPGARPEIARKLNELKQKQDEYKRGDDGRRLMVLGIIAILGIGLIFGDSSARAQAGVLGAVKAEPPLVTLFPQTLSNDEIFYIGGRATAPQAEVVIYLQEEKRGSTETYTAMTDKDGTWFFSLSRLLSSGRYVAWTQLRVGGELSPPSPQLNITVGETAIQIGGSRLSYQAFYLILLCVFAALAAGLLGFTLYHACHSRAKRRRLRREIQEAEDSIRRGFLILRGDIEAELAVVRRAKLNKELSAEEKLREEKLLKDIELVRGYIGREIWEIEEAEREL